MSQFKLSFERSVIDFLKRLSKTERKRIFLQLEKLKSNPFPLGVKRIQNTREKIYRIRIGLYRALYRVQNEEIIIFKIDKRSKVYRKY